MKIHFEKNSGAALIIALFIMALVAIAATAMSVDLQLSIRRTQLILTSSELYAAAQGVQFWAEGVLEDDANKQSSDSLIIDPLPQNFGPLDENGVQITGELLDAQSRFNLNNLTQPSAISQFQLLLKVIEPSLSTEKTFEIAKATASWINNNASDASANQYIEVYRNMQPPYQAAYMPMVSPSELRLVAGITPALYQALSPYIIALPTVTPINLNSASAAVIMSLGNHINKAQATAFIASRPVGGFANSSDLAASSSYQALNITSTATTLSSQYFLSIATATQHEQSLIIYTVLSRQPLNHKWLVSVVSQSEEEL